MVMATLLPGGRLKIDHGDEDPKQKLLEKVGDLSGLRLMFNTILVALYEPPAHKKTISGLYLPDKTRQESIWQGKVGLVVKMGPKAYKDDETTKFEGERVEVGDWVWFRPAEGEMAEVNGVPCRLFKENGIKAVIPDPDYVF